MGLVYCGNCDRALGTSMVTCVWCGSTERRDAPIGPVLIVRVCTSCESLAAPRIEGRGSFIVFLVLFMCFIAPGLVYLAWWLSSRREVCAKCGSDKLVPSDSPVGRKLTGEVA